MPVCVLLNVDRAAATLSKYHHTYSEFTFAWYADPLCSVRSSVRTSVVGFQL